MNATLFRDLAQEQWTSMEVYADHLLTGLRALQPIGWSFHDVRPNGLHLRHFHRASLYLDRIVTYPFYARRHQGQINHILDQSYGHLLHFVDPRRSVITYHGGTPIAEGLKLKAERDGPAIRFFSWALSGALTAARIIFVSEYARREVLAAYAYDPSHTCVVYHGVDTCFAPIDAATRQPARSRILAAGEARLILHVGHCAPRKNVEAALRAFAVLLKQSAAPCRFLQIGGTWSASQAAIIQDLGIAAHVTQIPQVPNQELPLFYNAADLFVFPSLYEGFGIPLIEAMACGVPVVCHDYELFHEVCGDAAEYADCTDAKALAVAMARALTQTEVAAVLRDRGLVRARQFSWQRCAEQTLAVYQNLIEETG